MIRKCYAFNFCFKILTVLSFFTLNSKTLDNNALLNVTQIAESLGVEISASLKNLLDQISLDNALSALTIKKVDQSNNLFSSVGTASFLGQEITIYLTTKKDPRILGLTTSKDQQAALEKAGHDGNLVSFAFTLPSNFKFKTISTYLMFLDELALAKTVFVLADTKYKDMQFGDVDKGLNLVGNLDFSSGMLSMVNDWSKKMLNLSLDKGVHVQALLPQNLNEMSLSVRLPESVTYPLAGMNSGIVPIEVFDIQLIINSAGLSGSAFIKPITLAGVTVSGKDLNPGILMNFTFDLWNLYEVSKLLWTFSTADLAKLTKLHMSGIVSVNAPGMGNKISGPATILLSKDGIAANVNIQIIKDFLKAQIMAKTDITDLNNWNITGHFDQNALNAFKNLMAQQAKIFLHKATVGINDATLKVNLAQQKMLQLASKRHTIEKENLENIEKAKQEVQRHLNDLSTLKKRLDEAKAQCK